MAVWRTRKKKKQLLGAGSVEAVEVFKGMKIEYAYYKLVTDMRSYIRLDREKQNLRRNFRHSQTTQGQTVQKSKKREIKNKTKTKGKQTQFWSESSCR